MAGKKYNEWSRLVLGLVLTVLFWALIKTKAIPAMIGIAATCFAASYLIFWLLERFRR